MPREYRHNAPSLPRLHHANEQAHEPHGEVEPETRPKPPTLGCQRPTVAPPQLRVCSLLFRAFS